jgi:hypothetical protein
VSSFRAVAAFERGVCDVGDEWMPGSSVGQVRSATDLCHACLVCHLRSAIRNVPDREKALQSIARSLRPSPSPPRQSMTIAANHVP